jgi:tRNA(Ile)-lysidine synthetase-like protein
MIKAVKQVLPKDRKYHVAVSMGADSVAALFWMRWKGYEVTPMHFNHNLRAQNAVMHDRFLRLCEKLGLEGESEIWGKGFGTEAECRDARLDFYRRKAKRETIVTAHHLDDWVESYLLNCFRGHPNKNPFELESRFPDFTIVHPFLPTSKRDFEEFLERNGWAHWVVQDETNSSTSGSRRNWIRHNILPEMARQKLSLEKYAKRRIKRLAEGVKPC